MTRAILFHTVLLFAFVVVQMNLPVQLVSGVMILPLLWIVFISVFSQKPIGPPLAFIAGFFMDTFSPLPFGVHILSFTAVAIVLDIATRHVLTNRSLYATLVLGVLATIIYRVLSWGTTALFSLATPAILQKNIPWFNPWQLVIHTVFLVVGFYCIVISRRLFQRYFLLQ